MIKGLAITPPVIGRICIGKLVQKQDKWVPEKDDSFTLTTQVQQNRDGCSIPCINTICRKRVPRGMSRPRSAPSRCGCCSTTAT